MVKNSLTFNNKCNIAHPTLGPGEHPPVLCATDETFCLGPLARRVMARAELGPMRSDLPRDVGLELYPAQREGVRRILAARGGRYLLAYGTGCGKTATALRALEALSERAKTVPFERVLIVCPAMVRRHWVREAARWLGWLAHPIEYGRNRRLPCKQAELRDRCYGGRVQVVSYDLLAQVDKGPYSAIVFDELHHVAQWQSQQSTMCRALIAANMPAYVIGLTATLIPTEIKQLWHPMLLLFGPKEWGALPRCGDVNWNFAHRYCQVEHNGYGLTVSGANPHNLKELRQRVGRVCHRVVREDIAADMPPLSVKMLDITGTALSHETRAAPSVMKAALEWADDLPEDIHHAVILTYHRKVAADIATKLGAQRPGEVLLINGSMTTGQRAIVLDRAEALQRCILVATSESVREGIRMMWAQKVLLAEWRQSPVMVVQVLGRFQSVGDTRKPQVDVLTDESLYGAANTLIERVGAINAVLRAGRVESVVESVFKAPDLTEDRLQALTARMFESHTPRDAAWQEDKDDAERW